MIIANAKYGIEIELKENRAYSLTVEANNCFADMAKNLYCQNKGEEGDFYLTENSKELKIEKYILDSLKFEDNRKTSIPGSKSMYSPQFLVYLSGFLQSVT